MRDNKQQCQAVMQVFMCNILSCYSLHSIVHCIDAIQKQWALLLCSVLRLCPSKDKSHLRTFEYIFLASANTNGVKWATVALLYVTYCRGAVHSSAISHLKSCTAHTEEGCAWNTDLKWEKNNFTDVRDHRMCFHLVVSAKKVFSKGEESLWRPYGWFIYDS